MVVFFENYDEKLNFSLLHFTPVEREVPVHGPNSSVFTSITPFKAADGSFFQKFVKKQNERGLSPGLLLVCHETANE